MKLSDFHYDLPAELIATRPAAQRTQSRLLVVDRAKQCWYDRQFSDVIDYLSPGDALVLNDSRVMPARVFAQKETGGQVEIFITRLLSGDRAQAWIRASKAPKSGARLSVNDRAGFVVLGREEAIFEVQLFGGDCIVSFLAEHGEMPLPPYMNRDADEADRVRYQTVFADETGSVAAPTAGLHFDQALLDRIAAKGVHIVKVTLHVGIGTFAPVRVARIEDHRMHAEVYHLSAESACILNQVRENGGRVIAVGTTSTRTLETIASTVSGAAPERMQRVDTANSNLVFQAVSGESEIFIYPGFRFQVVDSLITNFHLPESTLMMLVSAFASREFMLSVYRHAVESQYRFYSYGDAMIII